MTRLTESEIKILSFPDTQVTEFNFDPEGKRLQLKCSYGYLEVSPNGKELKNVILELFEFERVTISEFKNNKVAVISLYSPTLALRDVCEFIFTDTQISIKGFSKEGYWIEYCFENSEVMVCYG